MDTEVGATIAVRENELMVESQKMQITMHYCVIACIIRTFNSPSATLFI